MKVEIKVPAVGESITEATIGQWLKKDGDQVKKNDVLMSLETDKATVEVVAEQDGKLTIQEKAGTIVKIGATVAFVDTEAKGNSPAASSAPAPETKAAAPTKPGIVAAPAASTSHAEDLSPAVRRVVAERGLDPASISGSGKDGRITKYDAQTASDAPAATRG